MQPRDCIAAICLCFGAAIASAGSEPDLPKLPQFSLDALPQAARPAIERAVNAVVANPRDANANGRLAMLLFANKVYPAAEICLLRMRFLDPASIRWPYYLGLEEATHGKINEAVGALSDAVHADPDYVPAQLALGDSLLAAGRWDEAGKVYAGIVNKQTANAEGWYGLGRVQAAKAELQSAAQSLLKACELYAPFSAAHYALAQTYRRLQQTEESVRHLALFNADRSSRPDPEDPLLAEVQALGFDAGDQFRRGVGIAKQGKFAEAEAAFRRALEIDPAYPDARVNLGQVLEAQNRHSEALAEYRKALEANPADLRLEFGIGRILVNQEQYAEGISHLLKSLETRDENVKSSYLYATGAAYARAGRIEDAIRYLRMARALAAARGQSQLAEAVEADLRSLEQEGNPQ